MRYLDALAVAARGDLRKCLSTLEIALRGGTTDPAATHKSDAGVSDVHAVIGTAHLPRRQRQERCSMAWRCGSSPLDGSTPTDMKSTPMLLL